MITQITDRERTQAAVILALESARDEMEKRIAVLQAELAEYRLQYTTDARESFEEWFSDSGEHPKAIERDNKGEYMLASACSAWNAWREAWDIGGRNAIDERRFVHAESSRIYSRLASAVRSGACDATLVNLLRNEVYRRMKNEEKP